MLHVLTVCQVNFHARHGVRSTDDPHITQLHGKITEVHDQVEAKHIKSVRPVL